MKDITDKFLENAYNNALSSVGSGDKINTSLSKEIRKMLDVVLARAEFSKGVLTVIITSIAYKHMHPEQDIRLHQTSIEGGYSGRTFDTKYITPFMKNSKFPAMAESGWLTRSLEQKVPYSLTYSGAIRPDELKYSFLGIIDAIESAKTSTVFTSELLSYLFQGLIIQRNKQEIDLARPNNLSINKIINLLLSHFNGKYTADGASRLPVLALYAIYECLVDELKRFETKELLPIESHTTADSRSGSIGDIEVVDKEGKPFEAIEVKHGIPLTLQLVKDAYNKLSVTQAKRYYLLSTADIDKAEGGAIELEIEKIKNIHGCQVIVNGLQRSLNYYLRLIEDTSVFIDNYVSLLEDDTTIKFEHKEQWNKLVGKL